MGAGGMCKVPSSPSSRAKQREREREIITRVQPHRADAGAARIFPGRVKKILLVTVKGTPQRRHGHTPRLSTDPNPGPAAVNYSRIDRIWTSVPASLAD